MIWRNPCSTWLQEHFGPHKQTDTGDYIWIFAMFLTNFLIKDSWGNLTKTRGGRRCLKMRKQQVGIHVQLSSWKRPPQFVPKMSVLGLILLNIVWEDLENYLLSRHETVTHKDIQNSKSKTSSYKAQKNLTILTDWTIKLQVKVTVDECETLQMRQKITRAMCMIQWTLN